jgi:hypothetical protein
MNIRSYTINAILYLNAKGVKTHQAYLDRKNKCIRDLVKFDADNQRNRLYMLEFIRLQLYNKTDLCPDLINEIVKFL